MNPNHSNQLSLYNHSYHIDLIKIIAMFMVVYYHVCFYKQDFGYVAGMDPYLPNDTRMLMSICCAGVPFFFLCSGYCNQGKPWKGWKPLVKKVVTIAILTLFWNYVTPFPYWFFVTLCGLYMLTPMLKKAASQWPWLFWLVVLGIFLATMGMNLLFSYYAPAILTMIIINRG